MKNWLQRVQTLPRPYINVNYFQWIALKIFHRKTNEREDFITYIPYDLHYQIKARRNCTCFFSLNSDSGNFDGIIANFQRIDELETALKGKYIFAAVCVNVDCREQRFNLHITNTIHRHPLHCTKLATFYRRCVQMHLYQTIKMSSIKILHLY